MSAAVKQEDDGTVPTFLVHTMDVVTGRSGWLRYLDHVLYIEELSPVCGRGVHRCPACLETGPMDETR
jgi:hypothetical protein